MVVGVLTVLRSQRERAMYSNIEGGFRSPFALKGLKPPFSSQGRMKNSMNTFELSLDCTMQATIKCSSRVAISFRMQSLGQESFVIT